MHRHYENGPRQGAAAQADWDNDGAVASLIEEWFEEGEKVAEMVAGLQWDDLS